MVSLRSGLAERVAAAIAQARAQARAALCEAEEDEALARAQLATARTTAAALEPTLTAVRDGQVTEAEARCTVRRDELVRTLIATTAALPAAAVAPWSAWSVDAAPDRARAPELLRIGTLATEPRVPALMPLLDRGHLAIDGPDPAACDALIAGLLLRAIGATPPGAVRVSIYDPDRLGASLSAFAPLRTAGLVRFVGPGGLGGLLDEAVEEIRRVNERVLAGSYATLRERAFATGQRGEPWRLTVLLGGSVAAPAEQLDRIVRTGAACGVHLIARGMALRASGAGRVESVRMIADGAATSTTGALRCDPAPPADLVTSTSRLVADLAAVGPARGSLGDLLPEKLWTESSAYEVRAPIGVGAAGLVDLTLGDHPPHALVGGPSGSGKTNLLYATLASLTTRYSPDELALYLLDFKEGVSFARFAPGTKDPSWLPHVRLVGVNINNDREFGLALLRFLAAELRRRAAAARAREVTKLSELRTEDPGGQWPRILAVIDEFQVLLAGRDAVTSEAVTLLEDLARRGRSQGIHLMLASQDVAGIEALWGRAALVGQFALRIALPKARRILADTNIVAEEIPRFHAVLNADAGAQSANRIIRLCDAGDRAQWDALQKQMWQMREPSAVAPRLFDGEAVPRMDAAACMGVPRGRDPVAIVGAAIDVASRAAVVSFGRTPGRNLAVLGSRLDEACAVLASAAWSLARGVGVGPGGPTSTPGCAGPWSRGTASLHVVCFDDAAREAAQSVGGKFHDDLAELLSALDAGSFVIGYALDAAPASFRTGLRELLHSGPQRGVHIIGWWRGTARLRDDLGGVGARTDAIGAWVALDVHGAELAPFCPVPGGPAWYPRHRRALFFDRAVHRVPEIVIPYEVAA